MEPVIEKTPDFKPFKLRSGIAENTLLLIADNDVITEPHGSGFLIAPNLALTARHVVDFMWRENHYDKMMPSKDYEVDSNFKVYALQFLEGETDPAVWYAETTWNSEVTDISFLSLRPVNDLAKNYKMTVQPELAMEMPHKEEKITAYGFPKSSVNVIEREPDFKGEYKMSPSESTGRVVEVHERRRDRVMLNWACFEFDSRIDNGMSGGPVFNEQGQICGVVCSGEGDEERGYQSSASALWQAMYTGLEFSNDQIRKEGQFFAFDLFDGDFIRQNGWDKVLSGLNIKYKLERDQMNDNLRIEWLEPEEDLYEK